MPAVIRDPGYDRALRVNAMRDSNCTSDARRRARRVRLVLMAATAGATLFVAGTFLAPWLDQAGSAWGAMLRLLYAPACHQIAERSLVVVQGHTQAVCARCSGLYLGGVAGLVAGAWLWLGAGRRPRPIWLVLALAPTVADALAGWICLPSLSNVPRLLLAAPAGAVAGMFLASALADLVSYEPTERPHEPFTNHASRVVEEADG